MNTYKCVLVGEGGVGKSAFARQLVTNTFERKYLATLGVEVHSYQFSDSTRFNIWDTAGQEKFGGLRDGYYVQANCGMICFDLGSHFTFKNVMKWYSDLSKVTPNVVLVGFKSDLPPEFIRVSQEEILNLGLALEIPYFEISNKTGIGLDGPFSYFENIL